jgi:hypothetical protein
VHVPHKGAATRRIILIFQRQNAGRRNFKNGVPQLIAVAESPAHDRRRAAPQPRRYGVPHHGRRIFEHAANARVHKTGVVQSHIKGFDSVGDHASVKPAKRIKILVS